MSWIRTLNALDVIQGARLNQYNALESVCVGELRDGGAAGAAEVVGQSHPAVLLRGVCLGCTSGKFVCVFWDSYVCGEGAACQPAAG